MPKSPATTTDPDISPSVASPDIRPPSDMTPSGVPLSADLLRSINQTLAAIEDRSATVVIQVPVTELTGQRVLKGQLFVGINNHLSFATWVDKNLDVKSHLGYGVALRAKF